MNSERRAEAKAESNRFWRSLDPPHLVAAGWLAGVVLLTAVVLIVPRFSSRGDAPRSAPPREMVPPVTVRTVDGPDEVRTGAKPMRSSVAGSRTTYRGPAASEDPRPAPRRVIETRKVPVGIRSTRPTSPVAQQAPPSPPAASPRRVRTRTTRVTRREPRAGAGRKPDTRTWSLVQQGENRYTLKRPIQKPQPTLADKVGEAYRRADEKPVPVKPVEETSPDRAAAPSPVRSAVAPVAWQQSTDRREEAWFREKREARATPIADPD